MQSECPDQIWAMGHSCPGSVVTCPVLPLPWRPRTHRLPRWRVCLSLHFTTSALAHTRSSALAPHRVHWIVTASAPTHAARREQPAASSQQPAASSQPASQPLRPARPTDRDTAAPPLTPAATHYSMSSTPYIVLEKLGEGTYATVHKVCVCPSSRPCRGQARRARHGLARRAGHGLGATAVPRHYTES